MKSTAILACLALQAVFAISSHAALVVAWDMNNAPTGLNPPESWDQDDHVISSTLDTHGAVYQFNTTPGFYAGFGPSLNMSNYIGFTVKTTPGYQMNLTDLAYIVSADDASAGSHQWGYRIDNGSGFGAWTLSPVLTNATAIKTWDFSDFSTTGTVEFGFFATALATTNVVKPAAGAPNRNDLQLNGLVVTAVPEPSSVLLLSLGALGAFRRRR
ncbi:PEP-CTERM sorting domain-containing protein [Luteolibacter ambystomatis]|uniref:PEP-CTERM sorting domain-containing protein n=1 Tax=Luteolibacter ambystomatis TaxID=2824561 RepID=A0A975IXT8_9BACT|nr:PEP-CTERM sorting domain-containing protein [Luteolibacter ambystomatis]QUE49424.1 PEP-CTERM sorting domain-containing protein [Luteolibacter ambystomatis]